MPNHIHDGAMSFLDHIRELRRRLILSVLAVVAGSIVGFIFYKDYQPALFAPLGDLADFKYHTLQAPFMMMVKISFYFGILASIPVHLYNIVAFLLPAMTGRERRMGAYLLPASTILALAGAGMAYFYVVPWAVGFLESDGFNPTNIGKVNNMDDALKMIIQTLLAFIFLLQTPLLLIILMALNIVSRKTLWRSSRYAIVGIFILAAVVTPPDLPSQLALAVPLIFLYFMAIVVAKLFGFGNDPNATESN
ncbi:twin arginine-targeting protein translocase TatC [bacterium F16]|nr:twin arginine-targeting protein translocase TatC [bacterium F16]